MLLIKIWVLFACSFFVALAAGFSARGKDEDGGALFFFVIMAFISRVLGVKQTSMLPLKKPISSAVITKGIAWKVISSATTPQGIIAVVQSEDEEYMTYVFEEAPPQAFIPLKRRGRLVFQPIPPSQVKSRMQEWYEELTRADLKFPRSAISLQKK